MLHLATHSGFAVLNILFPVDGLVGNPEQPARPAVGAVFNSGKMRGFFDFFSFFQPQISAVPINHLVLLTQKLCRHCDIVDIGGRNFHRMDKTAVRIHPSVAFHAEIPLVPLFLSDAS